MKNDIKKAMRAIRNQLKLHTNSERRKLELRGYLNTLKKLNKQNDTDRIVSV